MWTSDQPYPTPDMGFVDKAVPLGVSTEALRGLDFEGTVVRTHTEWDTHYLRFTHRAIDFVAELNIDGMPYVEVQHGRPCVGLGLNERYRSVTCAQTGRPEAVRANRKFSLDSPVEPAEYWDVYRDVTVEQATISFGMALLGLGLTNDEYVKSATEVSQALRDLVFNDEAPWWPVWSARKY